MAKRTSKTPGKRPRIDLDDVRVFAVVARTLSIAAAARELRLTAGAVSRRLDELEGRLNATLLVRHATGVTLTEQGRLALDKAITIQRLGEEFERLLLSSDARPEGRVTIAAPDFLSTYLLAPHAGAFLDAHPGISLVFDCGFWSKFPPPDPPDITFAFDNSEKKGDDVWTPAAMMHYCTYASPAYLAKRGRPKTLTEIAGHRTQGNLSLNHQRERWDARTSALMSLMNDSFLTNCGTVTLQATIGGAGISVMPSYLPHLVTDELEIVFDQAFGSVWIWLVHHRDALKTERVRLVYDWLLERLNPRSNPWFREDFVHPRDFAAEIAAAKDPEPPPKSPRRRTRRG
jgi:DNA-binding transcriptional LysR family regulator